MQLCKRIASVKYPATGENLRVLTCLFFLTPDPPAIVGEIGENGPKEKACGNSWSPGGDGSGDNGTSKRSVELSQRVMILESYVQTTPGFLDDHTQFLSSLNVPCTKFL